MTGRLPEGFITIIAPEASSPTPPQSTLDEDDQVAAEVLLRGWKTYSTTNRVTLEVPAARLQNVFWRLWSNPFYSQSRPRQPSRTWYIDLHRDSGKSSSPPPRTAPSILLKSGAHETSGEPSIQHPSLPASTAVNYDTDTTPSSEISPAPSSNPPPSILKKSRPASDPRPKSVTVEVPSLGGDDEDDGESTSSNSPPLPEIRTAGGGSGGGGGGCGGKKKSSFAATTIAKTRTRPGLGRRKSSQERYHQLQINPDVLNLLPKLFRETRRVLEHALLVPPWDHRRPVSLLLLVHIQCSWLPATRRMAAFELPSASSWQSDESDVPSQTVKPQNARAQMQPSSALVDPNFRDLFAENQRRIASNTNLAAAGRLGKSGSVVRFADELPEDLRKGKEKEPVDQGRGGRSSSEWQEKGAEPRRDSGDSHVFEEEVDSGEELPHSKSQLSLLIESRRRQSGTRDIDSLPAAAPQPNKAKTEEDNLLMMARSEGVTKAGGVAPARGRQRISGTSEHRYRSPTPPPLYG